MSDKVIVSLVFDKKVLDDRNLDINDETVQMLLDKLLVDINGKKLQLMMSGDKMVYSEANRYNLDFVRDISKSLEIKFSSNNS